MISRKKFCKLLGLGALLLGTTPLRSGDAPPPSQPPVLPPASPPSPEKTTPPNPMESPRTSGAMEWSDPEWLQKWQAAPRLPILTSDDPRTRRLLAAIHEGEAVQIRYHAGTTPGQSRRISPVALFAVQGFSTPYLTAYCHAKNKPRHFRLDWVEVVI